MNPSYWLTLGAQLILPHPGLESKWGEKKMLWTGGNDPWRGRWGRVGAGKSPGAPLPSMSPTPTPACQRR